MFFWFSLRHNSIIENQRKMRGFFISWINITSWTCLLASGRNHFLLNSLIAYFFQVFIQLSCRYIDIMDYRNLFTGDLTANRLMYGTAKQEFETFCKFSKSFEENCKLNFERKTVAIVIFGIILDLRIVYAFCVAFVASNLPLNYTLFYENHFHKQHQTEIGKTLSKS